MFFRNEYYFLSNFYPCKICIDGIIYSNAESAFQAQKCISFEDKLKFQNLTASEAKKLGRKIKLRNNWDLIKVPIMWVILLEKFTQNPDLKAKLLATEYLELIEENSWNDKFWGVCNGKGCNVLGQLLMRVRGDLQSRQ